MSNIVSINSIAHIHQLLGLGKPLHPLISVVKHLPSMDVDLRGMKFDFGLYFISLKSDIKGAFTYGRTNYDFEEGSMVFVAPGQIIGVDQAHALDFSGWSLFFHGDLLRRSTLGKTIQNYSFFNYELDEALQLSDKEKESLSEFVAKIETEVQQNLDKHSQELIIHNLEAILKYSNRFYDRQFLTRSNSSKDFVAQFEQYINHYFNSSQLADCGLPTVSQCGQALHMSGHYLSDLLKSETGKSAKEHLHLKLIDKAKSKLLDSSQSVSEVAYDLGFVYPQNFSKLFKAKTGHSPTEYRKLN